MIQIIEVPTGYRTVVKCDVCGDLIVDDRMAVALRFPHDTVWHVHKGECHNLAERRVPAFRRGFMELREHIAQIEHNTRLPAGDE